MHIGICFFIKSDFIYMLIMFIETPHNFIYIYEYICFNIFKFSFCMLFLCLLIKFNENWFVISFVLFLIKHITAKTFE